MKYYIYKRMTTLSCLYKKSIVALMLCIFTMLSTSCGIIVGHFIEAVGGIESDITHKPEFAHLLNDTYEFKCDVFLYKYNDSYEYHVLSLGLFGKFSDFPPSVEEYEMNPHKYTFIKYVIPAGTQFTITQVADRYTSGGSVQETIYIVIYGCDYGDNRIDAHSIYRSCGRNPRTLDAKWVRQID